MENENLTKRSAIEMVIEYEKKEGREPKLVTRKNLGYVLLSGDRYIDVKVNNKKGDYLLSFSAFKNLGKNVTNYYVYIVGGTKEKPKLKILEPDFILKNLNLLTLINIKSKQINNIKEIDIK